MSEHRLRVKCPPSVSHLRIDTSLSQKRMVCEVDRFLCARYPCTTLIWKTPSPVSQTRIALTVEAAMAIETTIVFIFHVSRSLAHSRSATNEGRQQLPVRGVAWYRGARVSSAQFSLSWSGEEACGRMPGCACGWEKGGRDGKWGGGSDTHQHWFSRAPRTG